MPTLVANDRRELAYLNKVAGRSDGQERSFEKSFARISRAYIQDAAADLGNYELGFQLLERDSESNKAVGFWAFRVGRGKEAIDLFAPVFFNGGELKGNELLYLKDQDAFVPMKQGWVDYVINKRPFSLGKGVERNPNKAGVRSPDLASIHRSPLRKWSVDNRHIQEWARPFAATIDGILDQTSMVEAMFSQTKVASESNGFILKLASIPGALDATLRWAEREPWFLDAMTRYHGAELASLDPALVKAAAAPPVFVKKADAVDDMLKAIQNMVPMGDKKGVFKASVTIIRHSPGERLPEGLSDAEIDTLRDGGEVVRDDRPDSGVSELADAPIDDLHNPTETGIYDLLIKPGRFERCLVIYGPVGPETRSALCLVVQVERKGNPAALVHPTWVWGHHRHSDSWKDFVRDFAKADQLPDPSPDGVSHVILSEDENSPDGTLPFSVKNCFGGEVGADMYEVNFNTWTPYPNKPTYYKNINAARVYRQASDYGHNDPYTNRSYQPDGDPGQQFVQLGRGSGRLLEGKNGRIKVGKKARIIDVSIDHGCCGGGPLGEGREHEPFEMCFREQFTSDDLFGDDFRTLKVIVSSKGETYLNTNKMVTKEAFDKLVFDEMLRADDARKILSIPKGVETTFFIKKALSDFEQERAPGLPDEPYNSTIQVYHDSYLSDSPRHYTVPTERRHPRAEDVIDPQRKPQPDEEMRRYVQSAADAGDRDVFDAAVLTSMLKIQRTDLMIDRFVPDMFVGMDRKGRMIFILNWHRDDFAKRFGRDGVVEMEDGLRNGFEIDGDLILFYKNKGIEADRELEQRRRDPSRAD
jgi:hypothetical protein